MKPQIRERERNEKYVIFLEYISSIVVLNQIVFHLFKDHSLTHPHSHHSYSEFLVVKLKGDAAWRETAWTWQICMSNTSLCFLKEQQQKQHEKTLAFLKYFYFNLLFLLKRTTISKREKKNYFRNTDLNLSNNEDEKATIKF